jgi:hypothetical protein
MNRFDPLGRASAAAKQALVAKAGQRVLAAVDLGRRRHGVHEDDVTVAILDGDLGHDHLCIPMQFDRARQGANVDRLARLAHRGGRDSPGRRGSTLGPGHPPSSPSTFGACDGRSWPPILSRCPQPRGTGRRWARTLRHDSFRGSKRPAASPCMSLFLGPQVTPEENSRGPRAR